MATIYMFSLLKVGCTFFLFINENKGKIIVGIALVAGIAGGVIGFAVAHTVAIAILSAAIAAIVVASLAACCLGRQSLFSHGKGGLPAAGVTAPLQQACVP